MMHDFGYIDTEKLCRETQNTGLDHVCEHVCLYGLLPL